MSLPVYRCSQGALCGIMAAAVGFLRLTRSVWCLTFLAVRQPVKRGLKRPDLELISIVMLSCRDAVFINGSPEKAVGIMEIGTQIVYGFRPLAETCTRR